MKGLGTVHKLWLTASIAGLILGAGGWGFWYLIHRVRSSGAVLSGIQSRIEASAEERRGARVMEEILKRRRADLNRIAAFFVPRERPVAFIEEVERLAVSTGNTVVIDVDEARSDERALGFRFTIEGDETDILRYVRLLEDLPYKIEIEEMIFQRIPPELRLGPEAKPPARLIIILGVRAR